MCCQAIHVAVAVALLAGVGDGLFSESRLHKVALGLKNEEDHRRARSIISSSKENASSFGKRRTAWIPAQASGDGHARATLLTEKACEVSEYAASALESNFTANANAWTASNETLCGHLDGQTRGAWLQQLKEGGSPSSSIFSRICKAGKPPQMIEPLAGILRDPRMICANTPNPTEFLMSVDWLSLGDDGSLDTGKRRFFDAGGSKFMDSMQFFTSAYAERGIVFDEIFVWEAQKQGTEAYWAGVAPDVRARWEPKLTFYDGVPVSAEAGAKDNVVERIFQVCRPEDFCSFKLDIDTPPVESALVAQLLHSPSETGAKLDELFFEHHVHGLMQLYGWGDGVDGTFGDSYDIFRRLRGMGVRAHSWI